MKKCFVQINKTSEKALKKLPQNILKAFLTWVKSVEKIGIDAVRKIPGYHDEPLRGKRSGQRSVRLNRAYRAIYTESTDKQFVIILVIEVNKHEY